MATYIGQVALGGSNLPVASTLYGTCDTPAGTAAKVVTCANFDKLISGVTIYVKFTYTNSASNPTLNVNSTGAKNIYRYGTTAPSTSAATSWQAGSVVAFTYDGTNWQMVGWLNNNDMRTAASAAPLMDGTAAVGTSAKYAREDHVHPTDTSRAAASTTVTNVAWDGTNKKLTKTINGSTSDVVTASTLKTDLGLSSAMLFMGSLGTGGTITSLPAAAAGNQGYTYKVITAGTYASKAAKVGDVFVSTGSAWELIPSGDEPAGTVTSITLKAGSGITLDTDNSAITTSGTRTISHADTSSQASVSADGRKYITGVTLDTYGHVTGLTTGTETVTNTDRYVNSAAFADDTSANSSNPVKMTLTRAGSDTSTVTANLPKVSSSSAGVAPKGAAVSSQSQTTKFLREDGSWAAPSYTSNTHYTTHLRTASSATGTSQVTSETTSPYLNLLDDSTVRDSVRFVGSGTTTVKSSADGKTITISSADSKTGTVTSITPGNGLLNGTGTTAITSSGTLNLNYGTSATAIGTASAGSANTVSRSDHVHSISLATGDNNGQVKIAGTNVSVKGLGSNAYTSTEYAKRTHSVYYVLGSSSGSAGDWTGTIDSEVTELYDGLTIIFCPQKAGVSNSTNRTLTNDDSTTVSLRHTCLKILGVWKPVYYQQYNASNQTDQRLTTHYGANAMILMTYRTAANGGNGGWVAGADYNSDAPNYRQLDLYFRPYAATEAIYRYKICALDKDNRLVPLTITNQTDGTNIDKTQTAQAFKPDQFWFYNSTTTTSAGAVTPAQVLYRMFGDWSYPQYTFNTTIPAYTLTYLKGSFNTTTGLFTLDQTSHTSWQINVPTNTANLTLTDYFTSGSYYILMGGTYSSNNYFCFFENNPMFYFDGTNLVQVYHTAIKATQDGSGNNIVNTYLTKATGVTNVAWDSTNKKLTKTINGTTSDVVAIDTIKTALSLTKGDVGLGNVENKSSATIRGELTSSNVTTALGFTPYNATNPSGYTSNTGTVTKVTAGTGLSIGTTSGGNFTTTGTINHTNSVTAQTTQALYPIKIDAQGHISAYGTAVTSLPASDVSSWAKATSKPSYTASEVGLGNVSNNANLNGTTGAKGDIIYWSAANTPAHLTNTSSTTKNFLSITSQVPAWTTISKSDVGLGNVENTKLSTWTGSSNITTIGTLSSGTVPWARLSNVPVASSSNLGLIQLGYTASGKNYPVVLDDNNKAYVNVPWTDNNTTSFTITANATDGIWDLTGTNGTNAVTYAVAPYSAQQTKASFDTSTTNPTRTDRLNYNGYLYATKLYSGGAEVLTSHQSLTGYIPKSTLSGAYDIMYSSAANTPTRLAANTSATKKFLRMTGTGSAGAAPAWDTISATDVGLGNVENKSSATIRGELTSTDVTTALGFTPYNATNPNSYTSNTGTVTKVTAGSGLSIGTTAGGNFTTTGTINHTNSVTAQTTQALYPIKIDAQGHISAYGTAVTSLPASDVSAWAKAASKPTYTASEVGLGNVSNNATLNGTTGAKGDIIYWSAANTPAHLTNTSSTTKHFLSITSQVPAWTTLSNTDVGLGNVENKSSATIRSEITSSNVTTALGFTPYDADNYAIEDGTEVKRKLWISDTDAAPSGAATGDLVLYQGGLDASDIGAVPVNGQDGVLTRENDAVIAKEVYKTLYEDLNTGWSIGSTKTVPGILDYHLFAIRFKNASSGDNLATYVLGIIDANGGYLRGIGGYAYSATTDVTFYLTATLSNESMTLVNCHQFSTGSSGRTNLKIIGIYGII